MSDLGYDQIVYLASCAGRVALALERMAEAEEKRNKLIERDAVERREAWEKSERINDERFERIAGSEKEVLTDFGFVAPAVASLIEKATPAESAALWRYIGAAIEAAIERRAGPQQEQGHE